MKPWIWLVPLLAVTSRAAVESVPQVDAAPGRAWSAPALALAPAFASGFGAASIPSFAFPAAVDASIPKAGTSPSTKASPSRAAEARPAAAPLAALPAAAAAAGAPSSAASAEGRPARPADETSALQAARPFDGSAPSEWGPSWQPGVLDAADGAKLSYLYRPGTGRAVLFVHGRTIGAESFLGLQDSFPGRPLMFLQRRGYGGSEVGAVDEESMGRVEAEDVERAVAVARTLGDGGKVGVMAYSLGAMVQPPRAPEGAAWLALVNPGVPGMVNDFAPMLQASSLALRVMYNAVRWWPWQREAFVRSVIGATVAEFRKNVAVLSRGGKEALGKALVDDFELRMKSSRLRELWAQESLWAGFGAKTPISPRVPTLIFMNKGDQTVPRRAYNRLVRHLRRAAPFLRVVLSPGGHLAPVFEPAELRRVLEKFDAAL